VDDRTRTRPHREKRLLGGARTADDHRDRPTPRVLQREAKLTGVDRSAVVVE
jgi:hypothetical protein